MVKSVGFKFNRKWKPLRTFDQRREIYYLTLKKKKKTHSVKLAKMEAKRSTVIHVRGKSLQGWWQGDEDKQIQEKFRKWSSPNW